MKLKDYLDEYGIKKLQFAKKCGFTYRTLFQYLNGNDIRLSTAHKIVIATEGKVSLEDLLSKEA